MNLFKPKINQLAPNLEIKQWVQGSPSNVDQEKGNVLLISVFQINCPGCFLYAFPEIIALYDSFQDQPFKVWGLATAFEDFDINILLNLEKLLRNGEVTGQTLSALDQRGMLHEGKLTYKIPFPVAWDKIEKFEEDIDNSVDKLIKRDFPDFYNLPDSHKYTITEQVKFYFKNKRITSTSFDTYGLQGTPSTIFIDKKGFLRNRLFGAGHGLKQYVQNLLDE